MKTFNRFSFLALTMVLFFFTTGCEAIGAIFKTGVWSGVLLVVGGIALVIFLISKVFGGRKSS